MVNTIVTPHQNVQEYKYKIPTAPSLFGLVCLLLAFYIQMNTGRGGDGSLPKTKSPRSKTKSASPLESASPLGSDSKTKSLPKTKPLSKTKSDSKTAIRKTMKLREPDKIARLAKLVINAFKTMNLWFLSLDKLKYHTPYVESGSS